MEFYLLAYVHATAWVYAISNEKGPSGQSSTHIFTGALQRIRAVSSGSKRVLQENANALPLLVYFSSKEKPEELTPRAVLESPVIHAHAALIV